MKRFVFVLLLSLTVPLTSCAGKLGPNATVEQQQDFKRLEVVKAVNDAVDGIIQANDLKWLNDNDTILVLKALHVTLESIRNSSNPQSTVLSAITDIKNQLKNSPEAAKWNPYLDSLASVVGAL